jgi:predicted nucleic acid-binding protein
MDLADTIPLSEVIVNQTIQIKKKHKIKIPDANIAATALVENLTILTRNIEDFESISGLKYKNPVIDFV